VVVRKCMVIKKVVIPLQPKKFKVVKVPKDKIISPPKYKTKQTDVESYLRYKDERVRKHKRTVRKNEDKN